MSDGALRSLRIEHLRGSVRPFTLTFDRGKRLTIVYGENGTGKSTICDAFEFLGRGKVGSLENRGLGQTNRYWSSLGKKPADVSVSLETTSGSCRATLGRNGVTVLPADHRPRVEVLRRAQILALIESTPGDRYAAIKRFIDVSGVESAEGALRTLIRDLEGRQEVALARLQENREAVQRFWEGADLPDADALSWAHLESRRDPTTFDEEIVALRELRENFVRLAADCELVRQSDEALQTARSAYRAANQRLRECVAEAAAGAEETVELLQAADRYFVGHPTSLACPLCESPELAAGLAGRVQERLGRFTALQQAQANLQARRVEGEVAAQRRANLQQSLTEHGLSFEQSRAANGLAPDVPRPLSPAPRDVSDLSVWLASNTHLPGLWAEAEGARLGRKHVLNTLRQAVATHDSNLELFRELDSLLPRLQQALRVTEDERRRFTDAVLSTIAADVGRLYEMIHPGEGLNEISLALDPARRASLSIGARFGGRADAPPQAYFSDSHLDTLGLCVFLAMAGMDTPEDTILVLDDVLASVDEPHVDRLIEMVYEEAARFRHCVLTTHYRPWKHKLRWGWLKNGQCQFVELTRWTAADGLTLIRSVPDLERLRELLSESPPDPQLVCAKAGVILEAALDFLTLLYACSVPRRAEGLFTLGDLLPAVDGKLRQALRVEVLPAGGTSRASGYSTVPLGPCLDELHRIAQARNVLGCHFSALSFDLLDADAIAFGRQVLELMEALTDEEAGWPRNDRSGSYWATTGETRRLHPLRRPG